MDQDRKINRNDLFTGKLGTYNTTFNALVRKLGMSKANEIRQNKELYKDLNFTISGNANKAYHTTGNVRHPKFKVPAFYGMKQEIFETLAPPT